MQGFRMSKRTFWTVAICALAPSLLFLVLTNVHPAEPSSFVTIAEAFTSETQQHGIEVGYRIFSAPDMGEICAKAERPARLVAQKVPITLRVREWFLLDRLIILAEDAEGQQLPPVPITLEVEDKEPPLLNLRSDMIAEARVLPVRAGSFRFRARTICSDPAVEVLIEATVNES